MMNGGHLTGYHVLTRRCSAKLCQALARLIDPEVTAAKYGAGEDPFLFAVGDGNHSLATAKAFWEKLKQQTADPDTLHRPPGPLLPGGSGQSL